MPRRGRSLEEKAQFVAAIKSAIANGKSLDDAIGQSEIGRTTYFEYDNDLKSNSRSPIRKDWQTLARSWRPGGDLEILDQSDLVQLRREVAEALRMSFSQAVNPTANAATASLDWFVFCISQAKTAYEALDPKARDYLEQIHEPRPPIRRFSILFEAAIAMENNLVDMADAWKPFIKEAGIVGQGPRPDPRIPSLVVALGQIWRRFTGKRLTYTFDPAEDKLASPFNNFVESVRRHFLKEEMMVDHTFNRAMHDAAERFD